METLLTEKKSEKQFKTTEEILKGFEQDGYELVKEVEFQGRRGFRVHSKTAKVYETGKAKPVYYVEGNSYQMGYLMGLLAPKEVERMSDDYVYNFLPSMINPEVDPARFRLLWKLIWKFINYKNKRVAKRFKDIPAIYRAEIQGLVDGCASLNRRISFDNLWNLNTAFDLILSYLYTAYGLADLKKFIKKSMPSFKLSMLVPPVFCDGFSAFGNATSTGQDHYFGRDFMLSAADVLQHTAAMIIYNSTDVCDGRNAKAMVSVAAPGFVGSLTAMNEMGIGVGVNTVPAANCNRMRPGLNSIMLVRHCAQYASSAEEGVQIIREAQRGVPWLYFISDGKNDKAVVVEAGRKEKDINFLNYPSDELKTILPKADFIRKEPNAVIAKDGMMERWSDYEYPDAYLDYNKALFEHHDKNYDPNSFAEDGIIDEHFEDTNCPDSYYFAPIRSTKKDTIVVTNMYLIPEMRLCMMNPYTVRQIRKSKGVKTCKNTYDDIQWRYDTLNHLVEKAYGQIDFDKAVDLLAFLFPKGENPGYYAKNPKSSDGKTRTVEGTLSVCDLKKKIIKSHYGYYTDEWLQLTLTNYIQEQEN